MGGNTWGVLGGMDGWRAFCIAMGSDGAFELFIRHLLNASHSLFF